MPQKIVRIQEAIDFVNENGYLLAVYEKEQDGNFHKRTDDIRSLPSFPDRKVVVKTMGAATDFNEFTTVDRQLCFKLHNNFNIPEIIPAFSATK